MSNNRLLKAALGAMTETLPPKSWIIRILWGGIWNQRNRAIVCPEKPRLDGKIAVVTGGNGGVGYQTCRGLLIRGAEVVMASRNLERGVQACNKLRQELGRHINVSSLQMDLSDLNSVVTGSTELMSILAGRPIDILIANAGIAPKTYSQSPQGYELSFATNVLGHHLLFRRVQPYIRPKGRVVIVSGDIYCRAKECTPNFSYMGKQGSVSAYCRSKLGNMWQAQQMQDQYPELTVVAVHPGVVATNLGGDLNSRNNKPRQHSSRLINAELGAQTSLWCAAAANVAAGAYYHNTYGLMKLRASDPACDRDSAFELWQNCEQICAKWLS